MSTKNLARTVIEGGRRNVWERRHSTEEERAKLRQYIHNAKADPDEGLVPIRKPVSKDFSDVLNPVKRWLTKRVGRPWNDVHHEIIEKFDTRTLPGRHVVYGHLVGPQRWGTGDDFVLMGGFEVDANGILRESAPGPWQVAKRAAKRARQTLKYTHRSREGVIRWLKDRSVEEFNGSVFWVVGVEFHFERCLDRNYTCGRNHIVRQEEVRSEDIYSWRRSRFDGYTGETRIVNVRYHKFAMSWKRDRKFNDHELQYWKTLNPLWKERILKKEAF